MGVIRCRTLGLSLTIRLIRWQKILTLIQLGHCYIMAWAVIRSVLFATDCRRFVRLGAIRRLMGAKKQHAGENRTRRNDPKDRGSAA